MLKTKPSSNFGGLFELTLQLSLAKRKLGSWFGLACSQLQLGWSNGVIATLGTIFDRLMILFEDFSNFRKIEAAWLDKSLSPS